MYRNYLLVGIRNLLKNRAFAAINIAGYALGLACCFLLGQFVLHELRYDQHHLYANRTYRIIREDQNGDEWLQNARTAAVLAPTLKQHFPELSEVVRLIGGAGTGRYLLQVEDKAVYGTRLYLADPEVFRVFNLPFVQGDPQTALRDPRGLVLTETMARKYFGDEHPMGKTIHIKEGLIKGDYTVTGVLADPPNPSHLAINFLISIHRYPEKYRAIWFALSSYTYIVLPEMCSVETFRQKLSDFSAQLPSDGPDNLALQPLTDIHLHSHLDGEAEPNGDIQYVYLFSAIAGLILLIACINFVNLSTARSTLRGREVGVRKVLGARRKQIIGQFICESTLISLLALVFAMALAELLVGRFGALFGRTLPIHLFNSWQVPALYTLIALLTGVGASIYTAVYLSKFQPVQTLKGQRITGRSTLSLRRGLVIFQFAVTTMLIVCSTILYAQMHYVKTNPLGFNKDLVVVVSDTYVLGNHFVTFKNELAQHTNVVQITTGPPPGSAPRQFWGRSGGPQGSCIVYKVDYDYLKTLGIELKSGRSFSRDHGTDAGQALIVNEAFMRLVETEFLPPPPLRKRHVIGVVKDFHILSLHDKIEPLAMHLKTDQNASTIIRIRPKAIPETLAFFKDTWKQFISDRPFVYAFLDENLEAFYLAEQRLGRILLTFSILAVSIACLGLFGLTTFAAERRTREIGIRKIFGASIERIVFLLSGDFLRLVLLANLLAWPMAYYTMGKWLEGFAYRIHLGIDLFLLGSAISLSIALTTVIYQAFKAATANPVDALRYE